MLKQTNSSVLVVGAGPVGLAVAAMLKKHGLSVRVVDKGHGITPYSKAVGIHSSTLESMQALGIANDLVSDGCPLRRFQINRRAGFRVMSSSFDDVKSIYKFVLGLPQSRTERRLLDSLNAQGVDVEWKTSLKEVISSGDRGDPNSYAVVRLCDENEEEEIVSCNWLIGADGSRSKVREDLGVDFDGGDYGNAFILGDVRLDGIERFDQVQFYLSRNGYLLIVPMPRGMYRVIAQTDYSFVDFQGEKRPEATIEELQRIVDRSGPGNIKVHSPEWLTCAPFYYRTASTPVVGRSILVGDAFHLFSPLGAQGLNTGFQDAFNLAWKIALIEKGVAKIDIIDT